MEEKKTEKVSNNIEWNFFNANFDKLNMTIMKEYS